MNTNVVEFKRHLSNPEKYIQDMSSYTPDFKDLKNGREDMFLVFIYDECKKNHMYHGMVEDGVYLGTAFTTTPHYMMKIEPDQKQPVVFKFNNFRLGNRTVPLNMAGRITGELYAIPLRALCDLDMLMQNGVANDREEIWVSMEDNGFRSMLVWCYIGNHEFFDDGNDCIFHWKDAESTVTPIHGPFNRKFHYYDPTCFIESEEKKFDDQIPFEQVWPGCMTGVDNYDYM